MKRFVLTGLSALVLTSIAAPAVQAEPMTVVGASFPATAESAGMSVTPFNLVFLAYQGFFESEGIPMAGALVSWYQSGRVTADDLVRVAISMNRLSPDTIDNESYLTAVDRQLRALTEPGS